MLTNYQAKKNEVLDFYDQFVKHIEDLDRSLRKAGLPSPLPQLKTSLEDAEYKAENIRADRFRIMIAGEAKSGKSTFINAYLGLELMPMDVKQCTSSIVEIKYGKEFQLVATYADDRKIFIKGETSIKEFLKANAAIDDDYRDIPVPTINHDLLVRYGKKSDSQTVSIPESELKAFLSAQEIIDANIHKISNYNTKIRKYIETRKSNWRDIVIKMELLFPFKQDKFKGIEIIDSPGVCARGGVAEITENYIAKADAIVFLKPLSGSALESTQFTEFLKNRSVERNKDVLFLVLTRAADLTESELDKLRSEAIKQYSKTMPKNHIILVDSKAELYAIDFEKQANVQEHLFELNSITDENGKSTLENWLKGIFFESNNDKAEFLKLLKKTSNFDSINQAMELFGRKAHYLLLDSLLDVLSRIYTRIVGDVKEHIKRFKEKAEDPTELAKQIGIIKSQLDDINNKMYRGVDEIVSKYSSDDSDIKKNANAAAEHFRKGIGQINQNDSRSFEELENRTKRKIDEFKDLQESLQKAVVAECNKLLVALSNESEIPYTSLKPDFSEKTFKEIMDSTKAKADEKKSYETGVTFKKTHEYSEYNRNKHFDIVKNSIVSRLDGIKNDLIQNLIGFVNEISKRYIEELKQNADSKKIELDAIYEAKLNAEQIQEFIENFEDLLKVYNDANSRINSIQGGIK
jgi:hypothetical protein